MRKLLFVAMLFAFVGIANAQQKNVAATAQTTQKAPKSNLEEWSKAVNLTPEQEAQIKVIYEKYETKKGELRSSGNAEDFQKLNEERQKEINAILTPEQLEKVELYNKKKSEDKIVKENIKTTK